MSFSLQKSFVFLSISFLTLSFAVSLFSIDSFANPTNNMRFVVASDANLRDAPCGKALSVIKNNSEGLTTANPSASCKLTINSKTTDNIFIAVKMNDGKTGFLDTGLMVAVTTPAQGNPVSLNGKFVATEALKLREEPCGKVLSTVAQGAKGTVTSASTTCNLDGVMTSFVKVKLDDGKIGFLSEPYLSSKMDSIPAKKAISGTVRTGGTEQSPSSSNSKMVFLAGLVSSVLVLGLITSVFMFNKSKNSSAKNN
jgi:hypothetical protein